MREWLSGGVSPCQGEGRGFEARLALFYLSAPLDFTRGADFFCSIGLECQRPAVFRTLVKLHNLRFRFVSSIHLSRGLRLKEVCKILENLLFT